MAGLSSSLKLPAGNSFLAVSVCNRNKQKALTVLRHYEEPIEVTTSADPSPLCETLRPMTKGHSTFVVCHQTWRNVRLYILFCLLCIYLNIILCISMITPSTVHGYSYLWTCLTGHVFSFLFFLSSVLSNLPGT